MRDNPNNNMDSLYDEESAQFTTNSPNLKRPLTLDLNGKSQAPKRPRFNTSLNPVSVLSSPDLQMLKMASPELEKFIMSTNPMQTPTPSMFQKVPPPLKIFYILILHVPIYSLFLRGKRIVNFNIIFILFYRSHRNKKISQKVSRMH